MRTAKNNALERISLTRTTNLLVRFTVDKRFKYRAFLRTNTMNAFLHIAQKFTMKI